jgi:hypothetical protein
MFVCTVEEISHNIVRPYHFKGKQRRVFSPVKSRLNRLPVVTYRKQVETGRRS